MTTPVLSPVVLYDIPTAAGAVCWSPNVWRIRMMLRYKRISYKVEWVEMPDIAKIGKEIGAKPVVPNPDRSGSMMWTCPMLVDPNHLDSEGKPIALVDSFLIALHLDKAYPDHTLIPDGAHALLSGWLIFIRQNLSMKIMALVVPRCPNILAPRSKEYFIETRSKWLGPLDQVCPDREKAWKAVQEGLNMIAAALEANGTEKGENLRVIPGRESYADFAILVPLLWAEAIVSKEEMDALKSWNDGLWGKLFDLHAELLRTD